MPEPTGQTALWLDLMRAGDQTARQRLIEHSCERHRGLARKMLHRYPKVRRWEETDDVFVEAITRLHRALETIQPLSRHYYGAQGPGSHHETAAGKPDGDSQPRYETPDTTGEPASLAEWTEFHEQVGLLPTEEQEVFNLLWYEQMNQDEAAEVLGVTARTVRRRWQDARYRLCKARLGEPLPEE